MLFVVLRNNDQWGLLAVGRSGQIQVGVDQSCGPEELLALEITMPKWSLRFGIPGRVIVRELATFLGPEGDELITLGTFDGAPVEVRRDREYDSRFFLVIGHGCARAEFIIADQEVSDLSRALLKAAEDLK